MAASIDDIPTIPYEWAPETEWKPLRRFFGIGSFGTNLFRAPKAGDVLTEDHTEDPESGTRHEELYLVVTGSARFKVDGEEFDAPAGTFVYVPRPQEPARRGGHGARHRAPRRGRRAGVRLHTVGVGPGPAPVTRSGAVTHAGRTTERRGGPNGRPRSRSCRPTAPRSRPASRR